MCTVGLWHPEKHSSVGLQHALVGEKEMPSNCGPDLILEKNFTVVANYKELIIKGGWTMICSAMVWVSEKCLEVLSLRPWRWITMLLLAIFMLKVVRDFQELMKYTQELSVSGTTKSHLFFYIVRGLYDLSLSEGYKCAHTQTHTHSHTHTHTHAQRGGFAEDQSILPGLVTSLFPDTTNQLNIK